MTTATDFFCGAGGSSTGMVNAGIEVKMAANHWKQAIETHSANHPTTDHDLADLQQTHASRYPRTDIAWFSPSCTNHSLAKGKKRKSAHQLDLWGEHKIDPAEERSRATMREVIEFTEYHRYEIVIVENVVDIRHWQFYDEWLTAMFNLGYEYKILYLNAQFFGVPQSRDRFYGVFWKRGNKAPDLDFRPRANCPEHGLIDAVQVWKKEFHWGRYGARRQYIYRCPKCGTDVMPFYSPASSVIDWSIPSQRIGDREKPLKEKTIQRILAGLRKFSKPVVVDLAHSHARHNGKVSSTDDPLATQTTRATLSLVQQPFLTSYYSRESAKGWPVSELSEPIPTIPTEPRHALVTPPFIAVLRGPMTGIPLDGPLSTIVAAGFQHYLVEPFMLEYRRTYPLRGLDEPLACITGGAFNHGLVTPMLTSVNYFDDRCIPVDQPMPTQTTSNKVALLQPPFVMSYYGDNPTFAQVTEPLPTMRTVSHEALITPEDMLPECGFRMLSPEELKRGMSFPNSYVILGNKRDQVRQIGNAVACNVAEFIIRRCAESLS